VDIVEGQRWLAAARKHGRVVQVGTQRRSTPHLVEARDQIIREGKLGKVGLAEIYSYSGGGGGQDPPEMEPPASLDYEMWTGPAPRRPCIRGKHPRGWRQYMEYGNGTLGDMGIHMFDMTRWFLDLGWPKRISSSGGILVKTGRKANIPDTQTVIFDYDDVKVVAAPLKSPAPDQYPWGATLYGDKGTLKASVFGRLYAGGAGNGDPQGMTYDKQYRRQDGEKGPGAGAPAIRAH
jgi:predicted dehydrogenase